ncbi:hypothetical protein UFOVP1604_74 [uncultured Caudovirales phage]|uniref:Uncharacterized protein n=1 Tax=uncultured Caudovirales phage TaxID=2100421 RepID=A0A6J5SWI1_9CAUD|nr:hypothetical protein UFOVP1604_74 [uncultured Caudovirales phage]
MKGPVLHHIKAVFSQESSTNPEDWEELHIEMTFNPGAQAGFFTLKSKQWACDSVEDLAKIFESMQKMANEHETLL